MSSRCSRLGISGLNSPVLLCRFAGAVLSGFAVVCRVRLWVLWLAYALCFCWLAVFVFKISRRPSQAVLICSELWSLLFREGAHRATPYFILALFSAAAAAFFSFPEAVFGFRSASPFSVPFSFFFVFAPCQALLQKKSSFWGFFLQKGLTNRF